MEKRKDDTLGRKIKKLRIKQDLSQDELARRAGIPYTTLTKVEIGVIKNPSFDSVSKIAAALGVTLDSLKNDYIQNL